MFGVEMQLRFCVPCMRATLKVVESGILFLVLRAWLDPNFAAFEPWAEVLRDAITNKTLAS